MYTPMQIPKPSPSMATEQLYANAYQALSEGRTQEAVDTFTKMACLAPRDERAWVGLGTSLEQDGHPKRALGIYALGRQLAPNSVFCKLGRARTLAKLGRLPEALRVLDEAEVAANTVDEVALIDQMRGAL